jgi:hypothetical protein
VYTRIAATTSGATEKIGKLTALVKTLPQVEFVTEHLLHGGMYTRTVRLPEKALCTAVLILPSTVLITMGTLDVWSNDELTHVAGYNVIPGAAGRKIAFLTHSEVAMSMVMPCEAETVDEAQREFTSEFELLVPLSDVDRHRILITGE